MRTQSEVKCPAVGRMWQLCMHIFGAPRLRSAASIRSFDKRRVTPCTLSASVSALHLDVSDGIESYTRHSASVCIDLHCATDRRYVLISLRTEDTTKHISFGLLSQ
jgi:hypothetical protein